ncbi:glycosyltransferase family 4 protein [Ferruginibacter sp. HRS2-29]|uniref:glycosyltransferase family 4 protein n=1 Tax=Ferruginibacter sp. HRS2-29 TaxID=2487334 RepID=UPI0020CC165C|nr:glycosyltransferase family 4 protein [Ferruginibacter sp. HRS2-29]MCP9751934.1 glycosyltransferase [Ferruginibacter sp. HRS2-29]
MRIVYFLPDVEAGVSRIVKNLLRYRKKNSGYTYAVVLFRSDNQQMDACDGNFAADEVIRFYYPSEESAFSTFRRLSKTLKSQWDIIVGNDGLEIKMVATMRLQNPVVYILHGDFPYYYSMAKHYGTVVDGFIAYSNKIEKDVAAFENGAGRTRKIYYPSAAAADEPGNKKQPRGEKLKILFAGSLIERKGAHLLPAIYERIKKNGVDNFQFTIAGNGPLENALKQQLGDQPGVSFAGWLNEAAVMQEMKQADIFLFPSFLEGLPNVLIETLSAGAVPVAFDIESGVSDVIRNGVNGILLPVGDANAIADAVTGLYHDHAKFEMLRNNSAAMLQKFEPFAQADAYEKAIVEISQHKREGKIYPPYIRGRVLDRKWIPGWIVFFLRKIIRNPKL